MGIETRGRVADAAFGSWWGTRRFSPRCLPSAYGWRRRRGRRRGAARTRGRRDCRAGRFFLLRLALPLERPSHDLAELRRVSGVLTIRFRIAPLTLYGLGRAIGAEIPSAFRLGAAMPSAFHLLILAQVFDLRPHLMRLLVLGSTIPAVVAVVAATAVLH
jgi:hypothetical protein